MSRHQIVFGPSTVWVNAEDGSCIGRFGRGGIDVHRTGTEQIAGKGECLHCTHTPPTLADWELFKRLMLEHHGVDIGARASPPMFVRG